MEGEIIAGGLIVGGMIGQRGAPGKGISSIEKTGESGLTDTYTITYTNGDTQTYTITNGAKGDKGDKGDQGDQGIQGIQGEKGDKGDTGAQGVKGDKGDKGDKGQQGERGERGYTGSTGNGISLIEKTGTSGLVDTYTITYTDGTTSTYEVTNGAKGDKGDKGDTGNTGATGATGNGISTITKTGTSGLVDTYTITYTNGNTFTFDVTNGADGNVIDVKVEGTSVVSSGVANITGLATQAELDYYKTIYNVLPKVSGNGESITLDNTGESILKLDTRGQCKQETTTGNNKFNPALLSQETDYNSYNSSTGLWTTSSNGSYGRSIFYNVVGLNHDVDTTKVIKVKSNTTYTLKFYDFTITSGIDYRIHYCDSTGTYISNETASRVAETTFTTPATCEYIDIMRADSSGTLSFSKIQIEEGSSATSFEPYTNGASPNPSYPQVIHEVSGDNEVIVSSKNLSIGLRPGYYNQNTGEYTYNSGTSYVCGKNPVPVTSGSSYTLSVDGTAISGYFYAYDTNGNYIERIYKSSGIYTPSSNVAYFDYAPANNISVDSNVQVEVGSSATAFEPYGDTYELDLGVENLINNTATSQTISDVVITKNSDGTMLLNGTASANIILQLGTASLKAGETYTLSAGNTTTETGIRLDMRTGGGEVYNAWLLPTKPTYSPSSDVSLTLTMRIGSGTQLNNYLLKPQLEVGSKASSFSPYGTTPIKMRGIGTYEDYFVRNSDGQWCKYNAIGEVVLDGSENWTYVNSSFRHNVANLNTTGNDVIKQVSNYFKAITYSSIWSNYDYFVCYTLDGNVVLKNKDITNINDFKTWLSTHNTEVQYVLATPYLSLIENETLISQLDAIEKALGKDGQTNISQVNNDIPFKIYASALMKISGE